MTKIAAGIVGLGRAGTSYHLPAYLANDHTFLSAVCDPDESRAKEVSREFKVPCYENLEQMLREAEIDVLSICSPPAYHFEQSKFAMEAGVDIIVEKPVVTSSEEAIELGEIKRETGSKLCVGYNQKFKPEFRKAFELIDSGEIGDILNVYHEKYIDGQSDRTMSSNHWASVLPGGGWAERMPHPLYLIYEMVGDADVRSIDGGKPINGPGSLPGEVAILLEGDSYASIRYSANVKNKTVNTFIIQGTDGRIEIDALGARTVPYGGSRKDNFVYSTKKLVASIKHLNEAVLGRIYRQGSPSPSHEVLIDEFIDHIRGQSPPPVTWDEIMFTIETTFEIGEVLESMKQPSKPPNG